MLTRFAPSPTGFLHLGNIRTALLCWLYAKKAGGKLMLRIDDTDTERSSEEYVDAIHVDLAWLGITIDQHMRQSERFARYHEVMDELKAQGRVYACYETADELEIKRKMLLTRGLPPIYDREGLNLTAEQKAKYEAEGRKPHYRFKLDTAESRWQDEIRGEVVFAAENMSDPIIVRENGVYTYMFPSVVDDIDAKVTHVIRGEDHISNTAIQLQMFKAMGAEIPTFAHVALIKGKEGKLSKRLGSFGIKDLRAAGIEPMAVASFLAKLGTSDPIELRMTMQELVNEFGVSKFGKSPTIYEPEEIERLNTQFIHNLSFENARQKLGALGLGNITEAFWNAVRPNLEYLEDVKEWWRICNEPITPEIEEADYAAAALEVLPTGEWSEATWNQWIEAIKAKTGRKGKALFMPLRKALTGMEHGPEMQVLLPFIGKEKTTARLQGKAA